MDKKDIQHYVVKSLKIANYLVRSGYDILKVEDSRSNNFYKVFIFEDSPELRKEVKRYKKVLNRY
ncbi:DUF5659 domain-containing protein [Brassicibacter mesophilus]|uniref:DUF5659 domain-containing protein n=1 Tax=Brassicibacter mesophilus TaxID=745119 RepID=UPI003D1F163F